VGLLGGRAEDRLLGIADEAQVIPEVLDAFTLLVDHLVLGAVADLGVSVATASVAALEPWAE
jgi:hypothetical protein